MTERKQDWGNSRRGATNFSSPAVASERMDPESLAIAGEDACMIHLPATAAPAATDNWLAMAVGPGTLLPDAKTPMTLGPNSPSSVTEPNNHTTMGMVEVPVQPWFPPSFCEPSRPYDRDSQTQEKSPPSLYTRQQCQQHWQKQDTEDSRGTGS